jgi:hypothetical protein
MLPLLGLTLLAILNDNLPVRAVPQADLGSRAAKLHDGVRDERKQSSVTHHA